MSDVPRGWTTDEGRRLADARWPVLARLPDAASDAPTERFPNSGVSGGIEYRFDPPQPGDARGRTPDSLPAAISKQPHIFERDRPMGHRGFPRGESPVLPRSNPFSNPRPQLIDSVAPAVRFLTMVALFTAGGIWIQMAGRHAPAPTRSIEPPKTAAQPVLAPAKNADDHTVPGPTATGPIETQTESGTRVGRAEDDDFASQKNSAMGPVPVGHPMVSPPHFLISAGSNVPRVRVADANPAVADSSAQGATAHGPNDSSNESTDGRESEDGSAVARYPGFSMDMPKR